MQKTQRDFFVDSELVCQASSNITPELASGCYSETKSFFDQERKKLREILNACEQYSNK